MINVPAQGSNSISVRSFSSIPSQYWHDRNAMWNCKCIIQSTCLLDTYITDATHQSSYWNHYGLEAATPPISGSAVCLSTNTHIGCIGILSASGAVWYSVYHGLNYARVRGEQGQHLHWRTCTRCSQNIFNNHHPRDFKKPWAFIWYMYVYRVINTLCEILRLIKTLMN